MTSWLTLLTVFGLGSVVTTLVQGYVSSRAARKERQYIERKEAYVGLLESWRDQTKKGLENAIHFDTQDDPLLPDTTYLYVGHWLLRAQFVASNNVFRLLKLWDESTPGSEARVRITADLKGAMRDDLRK